MLLKFLNKPYPFNDDLRHNAKIIFFISIGILVFLIVFQPIDISNVSINKIILLIGGLGASTFLILTLNLIILPSIFPKIFNSSKWDIKKEILWNIWILLGISSSNLLFYSELSDIFTITFSDIGKLLLIASIPVAVLITINQDRLLRSHLKSAEFLNQKLLKKNAEQKVLIHFNSDYKNDEISLAPESITVIKSADNYVEIYYKRDKELIRHTLRNTLKNVEIICKPYPFLIRCHRGFLINLHEIKEIKGNSQGYKVYFHKLDFPVPVSPKYIQVFKKSIF